MSSCEAVVDRYLRQVESDLRCIEIDGGRRLLLDTPYLYQDGDVVQIVVEYLPGDLVRLGDEGAVLSRLELSGIDLQGGRPAKEAQAILRAYRVDLAGDELRGESDPSTIADLFLRLVGAMRALDGLSSLRSQPGSLRFERQVTTFLHSQFSDVEERPEAFGESGSRYRLTAAVPRAGHQVLIQSASGGQSQVGRRAVEHAFRVFSDINGARPKDQKLVILSTHEWAISDLRLLAKVAYVGGWTHQEKVIGFLKGQVRSEDPLLVPWQSSVDH